MRFFDKLHILNYSLLFYISSIFLEVLVLPTYYGQYNKTTEKKNMFHKIGMQGESRNKSGPNQMYFKIIF